MSANFVVPEQGHVVNIWPPSDINGAARTSDYWQMGKYAHCDIIITLGVTGAASTITVEESTTSSGSATTAIAFDYYAETTDAGDTLSVRTATSSSGFATSTNDNVMYVIHIDADQLTDTYDYLVLKMSNPGSSTFVSAIAILSGSRYEQECTPTTIT